METRTLLRPLVWVAKHQLSFARTASTSNANTQRHLSTSQYSYASIPDFLLPSSVTKKHHASTISHRRRPLLQSAPASPGHPLQRRMFSASTTAKAAIVTANPRKDEYGNEMLIDITARAANRLKEIMSKDSNPNLALRVTVESGGCHGFQYLMSLTNTSAISPEDDTIFESSDFSGAKVVMDEPSLELLKGSQVDFTMELIGSQFKIVGNPAATSSCGCGTSFDIKP